LHGARHVTRHLFIVLALLASSSNACVITLAYNDISAPPHYFGDAGKTPKHPGPAIELVDISAAKLGCKIVWQRKPLKRILRELETNTIDATLALSYSTSRANTMAYPLKNGAPDGSLALWTLSYDFYVKQGSTLTWDGKQFNRPPIRVGANAGYSVVRDLLALGVAVEEAQGDLNNLGKLVNDRIEAYAGQSLFVDQLREQEQFRGIEKLGPSIVRKDYFLVFSKGFYASSGDIAIQLWKQIEESKKISGAALDKKYRVLSSQSISIFQ
jgi:polar amino acid transport system substrate-binding protein